jgi:hypothetical protein
MLTNKQEHSCKAKTKSGKPCKAAATEGGLCFFHANPDKAAELGRIGGKSKRHVYMLDPNPLPVLDNAIAVRDTVARLIADVYSGRLSPRIASGLAPLLNIQLRAIDATDIELRMTRLDERLAVIEKSSGSVVRALPAKIEEVGIE